MPSQSSVDIKALFELRKDLHPFLSEQGDPKLFIEKLRPLAQEPDKKYYDEISECFDKSSPISDSCLNYFCIIIIFLYLYS